jgi:hypothetical protein
MAYENIRLRKRNVTLVDDYFWMMDEDTDSIIVKTDDGTIAYSYPLSTTITNQILSLEYDGYNIWSMEQSDTNELTIRKWYIDNYICTQRTELVLSDGSHNFQSEAFTVEHYHTAFSANESSGESTLSVDDGSNMANGDVLVLGPNSSGQMEEVTVNTATSNTATIYGTTSYAYSTGDSICFHKDIWLFNNQNGTDSSTGALYKIDSGTGAVVTVSGGGAYQNIKSCTFFDVPYYVFNPGSPSSTPKYNSICYIKGTNMIFLDPDNFSNSFGSMTMDNVQDDQATVIDVYDVAMAGTNVYRLQSKATYYGSTSTWSQYNYQLSTLHAFITSISLAAEPAILPANGTSQSDITAIVKDQFNLPVTGRIVYFTDDDPNGTLVPSNDATDSDGVANTIYTAGTSAREVRITATARQES